MEKAIRTQGQASTRERVVARELVWHNDRGFKLGPVDLVVVAGEVVAVIGGNGAGKSTLLRLLAGIWTPFSGEVQWPPARGVRDLSETQGSSRLTPAQLARAVGYMQQSLPTAVGLRVKEVVELGRFPHLSMEFPGSHRKVIDQALAVMAVENMANRPIDRLSGGERKRVFVAAVLAQQAPLLVLDEPTAHLDPSSHRLMAAAVRSYVGHEAESRAAVVATHDLHFARAIADRVVGIQDGEARDLGRSDEAFTASRLSSLFSTRFAGADQGPPVVDLEPVDLKKGDAGFQP